MVSVRVFAFDLIYLNGRSLLHTALDERQSLLRQHFRVTSDFALAESTSLTGYHEMEFQSTLQRAIDQGAEGLMLKLSGSTSVDTGYESGTRSKTWKKVKKDYIGGFADTIDVVPIGAWFGSGRKAQKGFLSPVLLAVYDEDDGVYRSISRCMSFSDEMYAAMRDFYLRGIPYPDSVGVDGGLSLPAELELDIDEITCTDDAATAVAPDILRADDDGDEEEEDSPTNSTYVEGASLAGEGVNCFPYRPPPSIFVTNESPPIWFKPSEVFEVSFADMSLSKAHSAAAGLVDDHQNRGVALRFPRFKRRRPDKGIEQATTCSDIARLFSQQSKVKRNSD